MTTINLGKVRLNWLGTYSAGTTYEINDAVLYSGDSWVCVAQSTGNAPITGTTINANWNALSRGLSSLTSVRGDMVIRGASGLERLPAGSPGQVLISGGQSANPYWANRQGRPNQSVYMGPNPVTAGNGTNTAASYYRQGIGSTESGMHSVPNGINGGYGNSYMITEDRKAIKSWGYQNYNTLGHSAHSNQYSASTYPGDRTNPQAQHCQFNTALDDDEYFAYITRNYDSVAVVTTKGKLFCVGYNGYGQFGDGTTTEKYIFTQSTFFGPGTGRTAKDVQIGRQYTGSSSTTCPWFVLTEEGQLFGAGYGAAGCLGQNNTSNLSTWTQIGAATLNAGGAAVLGYRFSGKCSTSNSYIWAWNSAGEYYGWGNINNYQLGFLTAPTTQRNTPSRMTELEAALTGIANTYPKDIMMHIGGNDNDRHIMIVLFADGRMVCSGTTNQGQAGIGGAASQTVNGWQVIPPPSGKTWDRLWGAGGFHSTYWAKTTDNYLYAWGHNNYRQIMDNSATDRVSPTLCSALPTDFQGNIDSVFCFGGNDTGTSYVTVWVKSIIGGRPRWASAGSTYHGSIGHPVYIPSIWTSGVNPREITAALPNFGVGLKSFDYGYMYSQYNSIFLVYEDGRMFAMGYDPNNGTTGTHDGSTYQSNIWYPRQVIYT